MRLKDFHTPKKPLHEAIRFGNKELSYIKQFSKDFKVGFEFEFEINDISNSPTAFEIDSHIDSFTDDYEFEYKLIDAVVDNNNEFSGIIAMMSNYFHTYSFASYISYTYLLDIEKIANTVLTEEDVPTLIEALEHFAADVTLEGNEKDILQELDKYFGLGLVDNFNILYADKSFLESCIERVENGETDSVLIDLEGIDTHDFKDFAEHLDSLAGAHGTIVDRDGYNLIDNFILKDYRERFDAIVNEERDELIEQERSDFIHNYQYFSNGSDTTNAMAVEYIKDTIDDYLDADEYIEDILEDGSLHNGGEVVTVPLQLDDVGTVFKAMKAYINDNGYTDENTGLHVNISHKSFSHADSFNPLKFLILHDPDLHQNESLRTLITGSTWTERSHMVTNLGKFLNENELENLAKNAPTSTPNALIDYLEERLDRIFISNEKFRSINFRHILGSPSDRSRLELRYVGGRNYQERFDDVMGTIYYSMFTILAGVEENFLKRDYQQGIIKLLNRRSRQLFGIDFFEYMSWIKKGSSVNRIGSFVTPTEYDHTDKNRRHKFNGIGKPDTTEVSRKLGTTSQLSKQAIKVYQKDLEALNAKFGDKDKEYLVTFNAIRNLTNLPKDLRQPSTWLDKSWEEFVEFIDSISSNDIMKAKKDNETNPEKYLRESFKRARENFEKDNPNKLEVREYLAKLRDNAFLKRIKNVHKKQISFWVDKPWGEYKEFIEEHSYSSTEIKVEEDHFVMPDGKKLYVVYDVSILALAHNYTLNRAISVENIKSVRYLLNGDVVRFNTILDYYNHIEEKTIVEFFEEELVKIISKEEIKRQVDFRGHIPMYLETFGIDLDFLKNNANTLETYMSRNTIKVDFKVNKDAREYIIDNYKDMPNIALNFLDSQDLKTIPDYSVMLKNVDDKNLSEQTIYKAIKLFFQKEDCYDLEFLESLLKLYKNGYDMDAMNTATYSFITVGDKDDFFDTLMEVMGDLFGDSLKKVLNGSLIQLIAYLKEEHILKFAKFVKEKALLGVYIDIVARKPFTFNVLVPTTVLIEYLTDYLNGKTSIRTHLSKWSRLSVEVRRFIESRIEETNDETLKSLVEQLEEDI